MWSITMDFVPKSKTIPMLAKILTASMRSSIGSSALLPSSIRSGLILKYLDVKYVGNQIFKVPTFVVFKVPFEHFQFNSYPAIMSVGQNPEKNPYN